MKLFAPETDTILEHLQHMKNLMDAEIREKLLAIYQAMSCIKPQPDDEVRTIWFEVPRGDISKFGSFRTYKREGEVETYEEFEQLWKDYYPKESKWYRLATARYREELFFYLNSKLIFSFHENAGLDEIPSYSNKEIVRFLDKLLIRIRQEIRKLVKDPDTWNGNLEKNLSHDKRYGRIKRADFWEILGPEAIRLDKNIGSKGIKKLRKYIKESGSPGYSPLIPEMSADDFFRYCEICYEANAYFPLGNDELSTREKYTRMADGRDSGLREIERNSTKAFSDWFHSSGWSIGHPWEICRGGNSTHISLFVHPKDTQWTLRLAGSSVGRVEETVKMVLSLYDHHIPFILSEAEEILRMVAGTDYIGIVPDYVFPRYCHSCFPKEDRIIDFMNLYREDEDRLIPLTYWYPLERIESGKI